MTRSRPTVDYPAAVAGVFVLMGIILSAAAPVAAQTLEASDDPGVLVIWTAVAGQGPDPVSDVSTTYDLLDAQTGSKITGRLDSPLPAGVTLEVTLEPPPGAVGQGAVTLTTTDQNLVTMIESGSYTALSIRYDFSAGVDAGVIPTASRLVTFTIVNPF